jgi:hypothetical protein
MKECRTQTRKEKPGNCAFRRPRGLAYSEFGPSLTRTKSHPHKLFHLLTRGVVSAQTYFPFREDAWTFRVEAQDGPLPPQREQVPTDARNGGVS